MAKNKYKSKHTPIVEVEVVSKTSRVRRICKKQSAILRRVNALKRLNYALLLNKETNHLLPSVVEKMQREVKTLETRV